MFCLETNYLFLTTSAKCDQWFYFAKFSIEISILTSVSEKCAESYIFYSTSFLLISSSLSPSYNHYKPGISWPPLKYFKELAYAHSFLIRGNERYAVIPLLCQVSKHHYQLSFIHVYQRCSLSVQTLYKRVTKWNWLSFSLGI